MTELMHNFHFLRPWLLVLLSVPVALYFLKFRNGRRFSSWEKVCDSKLLEYLLVKGKNPGQRVNRFMFLAALTLSIISAAGPSWQEVPKPMLSVQNPVMFLLNLSSDMQAKDVAPNRLERAKIEISDILQTVPDIESGLIVYSAEPFMISPLSNDAAIVDGLLEAVAPNIMPVNGDRLDRAIDLAVERIKAAGYAHGNIVVLSAEAGIDEAASLKAAQKAAAQNIFVSVVGVSKNPPRALADIAAAGKGAYASVSALSASKIADFLHSTLSDELRQSENFSAHRLDGGWYVLFAAMICFALLFRKGLLITILTFGIVSEASAGWLWTDAYQGQKLFEQGDYERAAELLQDPLYKGAALYRSGRFDDALNEFSKVQGVEALYNQGNALAKSGKIEEAIKVYEDVLQQQPDHEDAEFNLEYLKQQQEQQQQNQQQEQQQDSEQNDESEQNQNSSSQGGEGDSGQDEQNQNNADDENNGEQSSQGRDEQQNNESSGDNEHSSRENNPSAAEEDNQQQEMPAAVAEGQPDDKYDETVQARQQRFRDIPEDKGGLLRAFIRREYNKNRYGE